MKIVFDNSEARSHAVTAIEDEREFPGRSWKAPCLDPFYLEALELNGYRTLEELYGYDKEFFAIVCADNYSFNASERSISDHGRFSDLWVLDLVNFHF